MGGRIGRRRREKKGTTGRRRLGKAAAAGGCGGRGAVAVSEPMSRERVSAVGVSALLVCAAAAAAVLLFGSSAALRLADRFSAWRTKSDQSGHGAGKKKKISDWDNKRANKNNLRQVKTSIVTQTQLSCTATEGVHTSERARAPPAVAFFCEATCLCSVRLLQRVALHASSPATGTDRARALGWSWASSLRMIIRLKRCLCSHKRKKENLERACLM